MTSQKIVNIAVVPSQPGQRLIYKDEEGYYIGDFDVLAYRIETWELSDGSLRSESTPIEVDGEVHSSAVGVVSLNGQGVNLFGNSTYRNFSAFVDAMNEAGQKVWGYPAGTPAHEICC